MKMNIFIVFYSEGGHVYQLAEAIAEGARSVKGATVELFQAADDSHRSDQDPKKHELQEQKKQFGHIPYIEITELARADAVIFGTPSKFGMMAPAMRILLDRAEPLWSTGALIGKVGSVFTSATVLHGGQESTLTGFHAALLHLGMIIVGIPYCENRLLPMEPISGRNPYGATLLCEKKMTGRINETEIGIARFQGQYVAEITGFLVRGKTLSAGLS